MSGKIPDSANVAFEEPLFAIFGPARGQIYGKTAKKYKKMRVLARRAGYPSSDLRLRRPKGLKIVWPLLRQKIGKIGCKTSRIAYDF